MIIIEGDVTVSLQRIDNMRLLMLDNLLQQNEEVGEDADAYDAGGEAAQGRLEFVDVFVSQGDWLAEKIQAPKAVQKTILANFQY
jgi:hypothetical protein